MDDEREIAEAKNWVRQHCHHGHTRYLLERGMEYLEAIRRSGLCIESTDGEDLYQFLSAPECAAARQRSFVQPNL